MWSLKTAGYTLVTLRRKTQHVNNSKNRHIEFPYAYPVEVAGSYVSCALSTNKSPTGLGGAITSSSKNDVLVILTLQIMQRCTYMHIGLCPLRPDPADRSPRTLSRDVMHIPQYDIVRILCRDSQNLRWISHCTMRIEGRRHSWRILRGNGGIGDVWCGI